MDKYRIAMLGAGSWGTAIAIHMAKTGQEVLLWGHNKQQMSELATNRTNAKYLPGVSFPDSLHVHTDMRYCIENAQLVIIGVPSHAFMDILNQIPIKPQGLAWLTKGLDVETHQLLSTLVLDKFGDNFPIAVFAGPSFASEVALSLPTAILLAGNDLAFLKNLQQLLHHNNTRVYLSEDYTGAQLCGAVKNVLAIACGISDGLGHGANAKAALITRGLAEMSRLGLTMGAIPETFTGLAGMGDLVLTCTDDQSRNRRFGLYLGQGLSLTEAQNAVGQVVEGKHNAKQVCELAHSRHIEMPICEQVYHLLEGKITPEEATKNLLARPAKEE